MTLSVRTDVSADAASAARELSPLITRLRGDTEAGRRIAQPIVDRLVATRLCRMVVVKELQGLELPIAQALEVYEELARAEASVSWIVWNNALPCFFGRLLDRATRGEIFGDPSWLYASSTRPTGTASVEKGGYRVNGRWSLVSGCELAEWIVVLCRVEEDGAPRLMETGAPEMRLAFVHRSACRILDTWHAGGLRGTGSHDVVVTDAHVPRPRTASPGDPGTIDRPIGRVPMVATMAAGYGAQALGIARGCLDTLVEIVRTKVTPDPGPVPRDRPDVQVLIATAPAALQAARGHLRSCTSRLWDEVSAEGAPTIEGLTAVWTAAHHAVDAARRVVDGTYAAGGTTSLYTECPLERAHRDMHALLRHAIGQRTWLEDAGRVKLGLPPNSPLYAL
jgi:alkylation response protein AidB-like acyl-CoA dehydrogenase